MKKISSRFLSIYFLLTIAPWFWFYMIPGVPYLVELYNGIEIWIVNGVNGNLLHVKDTLNMNGGGSGDTSYNWAQFYTVLILSLVGCLVWTLLDRKRKDYNTLDYWLRNIVRYHIIMNAFTYGIIKLFCLQMPFPNLSQLATPLGDFLPMRFSWLFIGYSTPYQIFAGAMEVAVGILLLNRRTVMLGSIMGLGVFINVFVMNLSYDIPVKLFSLQLVFGCLFLVVAEWKRLLNFFIINKPTEPTITYNFEYQKRWQKIGRIAFKIVFIILFVILPFSENWDSYKTVRSKSELKPIKAGVYEIKTFRKNNDPLPVSINDRAAWKDFIFDRGGLGSINTTDTLFRQRYHRGYFMYQPDSVKGTITFKKNSTDPVALFELKFKIMNDTTIRLWGVVRNDSLYFELERGRHFQLAEKQFHWISESNR